MDYLTFRTHTEIIDLDISLIFFDKATQQRY